MASAEDDTGALGPWAGADLVGTATGHVGVGADDDLPKTVRFCRGVATLIRRRLAGTEKDGDPPRLAVFLLHAKPASDNQTEMRPRHVPMLDNGLTPLSGRLWFVSAAVVAGDYIDLPDVDDAGVFRLVNEELSLGTVPAIVLERRTAVPNARFYSNGLGTPETYDLLNIGPPNISIGRVLEIVDHVHGRCLVTPDAQLIDGKLWARSDAWWPAPRAEGLIQLHLKVGLTTAFPTCTVRHEQTQTSGRLDLEIEENDPLDRSKVTRHAVLELKVLKSFRSSGTAVSEQENLEWVDAGVKQAAAYRDERGARASALCCFDMRRENTYERCFDHVREVASQLVVVLRTWFLYASSAAYRESITATE